MSLNPRRLGSWHRHDARSEQGAVAIIVAAFMLVIMGLAAIVVDLGFARDRIRVAQNATDAAALAVAVCYTSPTGCPNPQGVADAYVTGNGWTYSAPTTSINPVAQTVTVTLRAQAAPSFFAGVLGYHNANVGGMATATWKASSPITCLLCVLGHYDGQTGDADLGGPLLVDGTIDFSGNGSIKVTNAALPDPAQVIGATGAVDAKGILTLNGAPATPFKLTPAFTDPYASLTWPPPSTAQYPVPLGTATVGSGACAPGTYIDFSGCTSLTGGGIYVVTGDGSTNKDTVVPLPAAPTPPDTMIYLTCGTNSGGKAPIVTYQKCNAGDHGATFGGAGKTDTSVSGLDSGPYAGIAVAYDPDRTATQTFAGNGKLTLTGSFYGASVSASFNGSGKGAFQGNANMVIREVTFAGNHDHLVIPGNGTPITVAPATPVHLIP